MLAPPETVVSGHDIWKIFGRNPLAALSEVRSAGADISGILKRHDAIIGVAGVDFEVRRGEILCIMGLSGSGKSTLIRHVNRLIEPTSGRVVIEGHDIGRMNAAELRQLRSKTVSMVFQSPCLFPHWSILQNVAYGLEIQGIARKKRIDIARETLELVHLGGWSERYPAELSGGMQQRVGIARALATDPTLILMDEPFSALDPLIRRQLQKEFLRIWRTLNKSALFITHDLDEAIRIGDRIAIMKDGRFVQVGTPEEIIANPRDAYVREFVQGISKLEFVRVHSVMTGADAYLARHGKTAADLAGLERVGPDWGLDRVIALKVDAGNTDPVVVENQDRGIIGVLTMVDLLRALRSG